MANAALIDLREIKKDYLMDQGGLGVPALRGIDLRIQPGEFVAIMGPSGSGKSTLLNILGTLDLPSSGHYSLAGYTVEDLGPQELAFLRNLTIGFVFQNFNLIQRRNLVDNVALPLVYRGTPHRTRHNRAMDMLEKVGLAHRHGHYPSQLSGGQQQRVAIARALVTTPKLLLADEPTGALDSNTSKQILNLFKSLHREGITIVMVTHDESVAGHAERVVRFKDGQIIYDGAPN